MEDAKKRLISFASTQQSTIDEKSTDTPKANIKKNEYKKAETMKGSLNNKFKALGVERKKTNHYTSISKFNFMSKGKRPEEKNIPPQKIVDPLEIGEEDKLFNELNQGSIFCHTETNVEQHHSKAKTLVSLLKIKKKKKAKILSGNDKLLSEVYQITPEFEKKIERAKRKKNSMSLKAYQNHLLNTISSNLSKDCFDGLEKSFNQIRSTCNKHYETNYKFLKQLERKEEYIINKINLEESMFEKMMNTTGKLFIKENSFSLPKIKFYRVIAKDKRAVTFYGRRRSNL